MDKYEYKVRSEEISKLIDKEKYADAVKIADTIDWRRVKSAAMLLKIAALYRISRRNEDSREMLMLAYERYPTNRSVVYSLCELSIELDDVVAAIEYYKRFAKLAPKDNGVYTLRYRILEAQEASLEERIEILEELKKKDYQEEWAYELAYLYHRVGLSTKCVEECDDIILWFGDGPYVMKAMELKAKHVPLTPMQQQNYEIMLGNAGRNYSNGNYDTGEYSGQDYPAEEYSGQDYPAGEYAGQGYSAEEYGGQDYPAEEYGGQDYGSGGYGGQDQASAGYGQQEYDPAVYGEQGYDTAGYGEQNYDPAVYGGQGYDTTGYGQQNDTGENYAEQGYAPADYSGQDYGESGYDQQDYDGGTYEGGYGQEGYSNGQYAGEDYSQQDYGDGQYAGEDYSQQDYGGGQYAGEDYSQQDYGDAQYVENGYGQSAPNNFVDDGYGNLSYVDDTYQDNGYTSEFYVEQTYDENGNLISPEMYDDSAARQGEDVQDRGYADQNSALGKYRNGLRLVENTAAPAANSGDMSQYNTINLQKVVAESMKELFPDDNDDVFAEDREKYNSGSDIVSSMGDTRIFAGTSGLGAAKTKPDGSAGSQVHTTGRVNVAQMVTGVSEKVPEPHTGAIKKVLVPGGDARSIRSESDMEELRDTTEQSVDDEHSRMEFNDENVYHEQSIMDTGETEDASQDQASGPMKLDEVLVKWERMKQDNAKKNQQEIKKRVLTQTGKIFANFDNSIKSGILGELAREEEEAEKKQQDSSAPAQGNPVRRGSDGFLDADVTGDIPQQPESEDDFDVAYVTDRRQGARSQKPATVPHRSGIYEAGADPATAEEGVYAPRTGAKDDEDHDAGNTPYTEDADAERPAEYPDEAYAESPAEYPGETYTEQTGGFTDETYAQDGIEHAEEPAGDPEDTGMDTPKMRIKEADAERAGGDTQQLLPAESGAYTGEVYAESAGDYTGEIDPENASAYAEEEGCAEEAYAEEDNGYTDEAYAEEDSGCIDEAYAEEDSSCTEEAYAEEDSGYAEEAYAEEDSGYTDEVYAEEGGYTDEAYAEEDSGYTDTAYAGEAGEYTEEIRTPDDSAYTDDAYAGEAGAYTQELNTEEAGAYTGGGYAEEGEVYREDSAKYTDTSYDDMYDDLEDAYSESPEEARSPRHIERRQHYEYNERDLDPEDAESIAEMAKEDALKTQEIKMNTADLSSLSEKIVATTKKEASGARREEIRDFTPEEQTLFENFAVTRKIKKQIIYALENMTLAAYTGNVIITGDAGLDTVRMAKNLIKEYQASDESFSGKLAKITGEKINQRNIKDVFEKLNNGGIIIEKANGMSEEKLYELAINLNQDTLGIVVIMEDTKKEITKLLGKQAMIVDYFNIRIDLMEMDNNALVAYAKNYALALEYSIDELGTLALYTRIANMQSGNHVVTKDEVRDIIDEAIWKSKKSKIKNFVDVLFARRYDNEDMIVLKERDFM